MQSTAAVSRPGSPAPALEQVELEPPRSDEVLVRIVATGICLTDIHSHAGHGIGGIVPDGFDFSFVTADHPSVYASALACLGAEGSCGIAVAPHGDWSVDVAHLLAGGRKLQGIIGGSANPPTFIPMLVEYWRQGRFPFDRLIQTYPFADIARAWEDAISGGTIKPVLLMPAG